MTSRESSFKRSIRSRRTLSARSAIAGRAATSVPSTVKGTRADSRCSPTGPPRPARWCARRRVERRVQQNTAIPGYSGGLLPRKGSWPPRRPWPRLPCGAIFRDKRGLGAIPLDGGKPAGVDTWEKDLLHVRGGHVDACSSRMSASARASLGVYALL